MLNSSFNTQSGLAVPAVDAEMMQRVDRLAVEQYGLSILQMMENAGRMLAQTAIEMLAADPGRIVILAGSGGNGGGGLCGARHLLNRGFAVDVFLSRPAAYLSPAARAQWDTLQQMGLLPLAHDQLAETLAACRLVIDALIGYGLQNSPHEPLSRLISYANDSRRPILSLDIPSGIAASTGETPGTSIAAHKTLTLALPKFGLRHPASADLVLGDIGIPNKVYADLGLQVPNLFTQAQRIALVRQ